MESVKATVVLVHHKSGCESCHGCGYRPDFFDLHHQDYVPETPAEAEAVRLCEEMILPCKRHACYYIDMEDMRP